MVTNQAVQLEQFKLGRLDKHLGKWREQQMLQSTWEAIVRKLFLPRARGCRSCDPLFLDYKRLKKEK